MTHPPPNVSHLDKVPTDEPLHPLPLGAPTATEVTWPLSRWLQLATSLVTPDILERAKRFAAELMAPHALIMRDARGDFGLAIGVLTPAEASLPVTSRLAEVTTRHVLLELGQALQMTQLDHDAARVLAAVAHAFTIDPHGARAAAMAAHPEAVNDPRSGRFEREAFTYWAHAVQRAGGLEDDVYRLAVRRGAWRHYMQRPLEHFEPTLTRKPFWESAELPAARALEAAFPEILAELHALMSPQAGGASVSFAKYHSRVVAAGGWSDVQLFAGCRRDRAHCERCPRTASVIAAQPRLNSVIFGSHFFSRLVPGTHLSKHCGPSNFRLRCHLALTVPPGVRIRVGHETREWQPGKCLIFDDSFEHEVWHDGAEDRVVLICDLWHPEIILEKHIVPLLNEKQREGLSAAVAQRHLVLQERTYSTGASVARD